MNLFFKKLSNSEMKVAKECLEILEKYHDEIHLHMPAFLKMEDGYQGSPSFCNTSCCLLGSHAIVHNADKIDNTRFSYYCSSLGIDAFGRFSMFAFAPEWPAEDKTHAKKRLEFCIKTGYVPCLEIVDLRRSYNIYRLIYRINDELKVFDPSRSEWLTDPYQIFPKLDIAMDKRGEWIQCHSPEIMYYSF